MSHPIPVDCLRIHMTDDLFNLDHHPVITIGRGLDGDRILVPLKGTQGTLAIETRYACAYIIPEGVEAPTTTPIEFPTDEDDGFFRFTSEISIPVCVHSILVDLSKRFEYKDGFITRPY